MTETPKPLDSPAVRDLIEQLYSAFNEPNDLLTEPWYSPDREEVVAELIKHDRRNLEHAAGDMYDWLIWCLTYTIGTPQTLRHYLPAVFEELLRQPEAFQDDFWMFVRKIAGAGFADWSPEQRRLVCTVVRLWLAYCIMQTEDVTAADFPELEPEAVIATTPAAFLLDLLGTRGHTLHSPEPELFDFILDAERALASPHSEATKRRDVKK